MQLAPHLDFRCSLGGSLHLGVCGSIAAYKALDLLRLWTSHGLDVSCTLTAAAQAFVQPLSFQALGASSVFTRMLPVEDERYAHLAPGREGKAFVIAPASANSLAKFAHGLADDMLSCQALSYPGSLVLAPAMNPKMWHAAATQANVALLRERGHVLVGPESGDVACGDQGQGRLASLDLIFLHGLKATVAQDMKGLRVLLTIGPTREYWDSVRFWSNPSSGIMGASLAVAAWLRGAEVVAVCGPGVPWLPEGVTRLDVTSAAEMFDACVSQWPACDVGCFTAAVADFRPAERHKEKQKKQQLANEIAISFSANADILATLAGKKTSQQKLIGFAAETSELESRALDKLRRKNLDMIVGNRVDMPGSGFGTATNKVLLLDAKGRTESWPLLPKPEIAWRIWDWLALASS